MSFRRVVGFGEFVVALLALAACAHDWDEHLYEAGEPASSTSSTSTSGGGGAGGCSPGADTRFLDAGCDTHSHAGYYFDVKAKQPIRVTGFETVSGKCGTEGCPCPVRGVSIWYRKGTHSGSDPDAGVPIAKNKNAWTLLGHRDDFAPVCSHECPIAPTLVPIDFCPLEIDAGEPYAFYIVMTSGDGSFESRNDLTTGTPYAEDDYITLYAGSGQDSVGEFEGDILPNLAWSGSIVYDD